MSIPLPPLMSHRVLAQIDHDSRCLRQHDPVARPRPLRERPCRFAIPPAPLSARSRPVNTLGPSRALRDATLQPLTSEWRENGKPASDGEIHKLAMETQAAAQKLKARTLRSDIFFVEANASFEAASARSVVTNATRKAAVKERVLARPRDALATFHQHYPASRARSLLRTGTAPPLRTCGMVGQLEYSLMPARTAWSPSTSKVSKGVSTALRICTTVLEKPHCGKSLLPARRRARPARQACVALSNERATLVQIARAAPFIKSMTLLSLISSSSLPLVAPSSSIRAADARAEAEDEARAAGVGGVRSEWTSASMEKSSATTLTIVAAGDQLGPG